jgi:hypothetical protein
MAFFPSLVQKPSSYAAGAWARNAQNYPEAEQGITRLWSGARESRSEDELKASRD